MLEGLNVDLIKENILKTNKNIIVGGGLSNYDDLINLKKFHLQTWKELLLGNPFIQEILKLQKL